MQHLYSSRVEVREQLLDASGGRTTFRWVPVEGLTRMACRLDLQFLRPGKDTPSAPAAGVIPDREGIMFCAVDSRLKAGMQIRTVNDRFGRQVVKGTFEIKEMPDTALDYNSAHHIEVKIIESVQKPGLMPDVNTNKDPLATVVPIDDDSVSLPDVRNP